MTTLAQTVDKIRSKNAGPFWVTIDIFCGSDAAFAAVTQRLTTQAVAQRFAVDADTLKRFDIPDLAVVKFSLPRPAIQGTPSDRDMHGAGFGLLLADLELTA